MRRVLILEPYYGGSHQVFLEGLQAHVQAEYTMFTLPARRWKLRMQLSALWAIEKIKGLPPPGRWFDTVLCSSFVDVAVFRALLGQVDGWNHTARICTYFHENQMDYPTREKGKESFQFAAINFNSALASDKIAFNSRYNAETFLAGCQKYLQTAAEMELPETLLQLKRRSCILFPGIDFTLIDRQKRVSEQGPPIIIWNHRWEHDKNPERFFQALNEVSSWGLDFRLILLGKTFPNSPPCFAEAKKAWPSQIVHYGYADTYATYAALLCRGDVVVSTAVHEFFGIAIIEAVRAQCLPLLPERLAYPELFPPACLYREKQLSERLGQAIGQRRRLSSQEAVALTDRFDWKNLASSYRQWLFEEEVEGAITVETSGDRSLE
jgi:glycosyltransferase involved in cell wall biosynthesis